MGSLKLTCIGEGVLYRNPIPHVYSRQAFFPSVLQLANGEMIATFSIGQAFESSDMHTVVARSTDRGETWAVEGRIYGGTTDRVTSDVCRISHGERGEIIAYMNRHDRFRQDQGVANPANLGFVEVELFLLRSSDGGRTWGNPELIDPPLVGPSFEMTSPIVPLKDGRWLLPTSTWRGWDGYCPNGMKAVAFMSSDQGKTWPTYVDVMSDIENGTIFWESKIIELNDGRLLAIAWAYSEKLGDDLPNPFAISTGAGQPFSPPGSTGMHGQTATFMQLPSGVILTVYRRIDQAGLWAGLSEVRGDEWHLTGEQFPLWGTQRHNLTGQDSNMAHNFAVLKFGAPALCKMDDGTIFVAFWAVEDGAGLIRWIKLRLDDSSSL